MRVTQAGSPLWQANIERPEEVEAQAPQDAFVRPVDPRLNEVPAVAMSNFNNTAHWTPQFAFRPRNIDDLQRVLRYVHEQLPNGTPIKAGGSRHSVDAAATQGVYIHPEGMKFTQRLDDTTVRVGSGTTVRELNDQLWAMGLSLPVLGGYDGQTMGGVFATGTHGSVLTRGPLNTMIKSMDLVTVDGSKVRIEPTLGMTRQAPDGMRLIQDDKVFAAARTSLGAMGVVHSFVLEAVPKFWLRETRHIGTLDEVRARLKDGGAYRLPAYHTEIAFNPYTGLQVFTERSKIDLKTEPFDMSERPGRNIIHTLELGPKYTRPAFGEWFQQHFFKAIGFLSDATQAIWPKQVPKLVNSAVRTLKDDEYIQRSYNVFHLGDGAAKIPVRFGSLFVPLRGDMYLRAMDILCAAAKEYSAKHAKYEGGPISIRFIKGTDSQLGVAEDVASFEVIYAGHPEHAPAMFDFYRESLERALGKENVTVHLGQMTGEADVSRYPRLAEWKAIRAQFDPDGVFLNDQQKKMGL